ncbi:autotransporter domain-containing protein [Bradyrhizobium sp. UFLA05-153]
MLFPTERELEFLTSLKRSWRSLYREECVRITACGTLGWRHATPLSTVAFQGGSDFNVAGVPIAREAALVEAGLDLAITPTATFGGAFAGRATGQSVKGTFAIRF